MDNVTTLSDFQREIVGVRGYNDELVPLAKAANGFLAELVLTRTRSEFQREVGNVLASLAFYAEMNGHDIGDVSAEYGALVNGPTLSTRDWTAANMGRLLWYAGEAGDDEFNEKSALAGVIAGLAEMCHNAGIDLESAANEVLNG